MSQSDEQPRDNSSRPNQGHGPPIPGQPIARELIRSLRHDVRTPIYHIVGYCEMWQDAAELQGRAELLTGLQKVFSAGQRLLAGVDAVLDVDHPSTGTGAADRIDRDLRDPLDAVIGYTELLREGIADPDQADLAADLERILTAAQQVRAYLGAIPPLLAQVAGLPAALPGAGAGRPPVDVSGPPAGEAAIARGARLLVVDDNELNRDLLARRLERLGHVIALAENGRQALAKLRSEPFDLVLLDIVMPVLDGYHVLAEMKSDPVLHDIPVIVLSTLDDLDSVVPCIEMGAADYLAKPFNPVLLRARVGACLEQKHLRDQEVDYLRQVARVTGAAALVEAGQYDLESLADVADRPDALGGLMRVFRSMVRQVYAREQSLKRQVEKLRIEVDEAKKMRQVAEITDTEYFQQLRSMAQKLRGQSDQAAE